MFDDGWEAYREKRFARQKELGVVPADAELSRHDPDVKPWDECSPVSMQHYQGPFPYGGKLFSVTFDISGDLIRDSEAEMRMVMARQ